MNAEPDVQAMAPDLPVVLLEPFRTSGPAPDATAEPIAWGVRAVGADTSSRTGQGITVAVLDTGIDAGHAAFQGMTVVQKDFTGTGNADVDGHGTHCAGTIFGRDVDGQRIGVARGVQRALIAKVLAPNAGSTQSVVSAMNWAVENGANVISMSLGIDFPGYVARLVNYGFRPEVATTKALHAYRLTVNMYQSLAQSLSSYHQLTGGACVLIAAAGNESARSANEAQSFEIEASPPAVSNGFICVGALEQVGGQLKTARFSNTLVNISAPGVAVLSARAGGGLALMDGTSMATPYVAGVAALWAEELRANQQLRTPFLQARLVGSATLLRMAPGFKPADVGLGLVQAPRAPHPLG